jgi:hypothetical protein
MSPAPTAAPLTEPAAPLTGPAASLTGPAASLTGPAASLAGPAAPLTEPAAPPAYPPTADPRHASPPIPEPLPATTPTGSAAYQPAAQPPASESAAYLAVAPVPVSPPGEAGAYPPVAPAPASPPGGPGSYPVPEPGGWTFATEPTGPLPGGADWPGASPYPGAQPTAPIGPYGYGSARQETAPIGPAGAPLPPRPEPVRSRGRALPWVLAVLAVILVAGGAVLGVNGFRHIGDLHDQASALRTQRDNDIQATAATAAKQREDLKAADLPGKLKAVQDADAAADDAFRKWDTGTAKFGTLDEAMDRCDDAVDTYNRAAAPFPADLLGSLPQRIDIHRESTDCGRGFTQDI